MIELNPELADKLGFRITFENDKFGLNMILVGPETIDDVCVFDRSGVYFRDKDGKDIGSTFTRAQIYQREPVLRVIINKNKTDTSVVVDYTCPPGNKKKNRQYFIESVSQYSLSIRK